MLNTLWIYDIADDSWSPGADLPGPRFGSAVAVVGGQIIVAGGFMGGMIGDETATTWSYDPVGDTWTTGLANMPFAVGRVHGVGIEPAAGGGTAGQVHVFAGGFDGFNHFIYDVGADAWVTSTRMPFGVTDPATATDGLVIYVCGGGGMPPRGPGRTQIWDLSTETWSQGPLMPAPALDNTSGVLVGGVIYVEGGFNGTMSVSNNFALTVGEK